MTSTNTDPIIRDFREQIAAIDLKLAEALNERIEVAKRLKDYKESKGLGFYDADQETRLLANLCQTNRGPMTNESLREIFEFILDWSKRQTARLGEPKAP